MLAEQVDYKQKQQANLPGSLSGSFLSVIQALKLFLSQAVLKM